MKPDTVPLSAQETIGAAALGSMPEQITTTRTLCDSVPLFTRLEQGNIIVEYATRRDKLIFHVYHAERKTLVDTALELANRMPDPRRMQQIDADLTEDLESCPWWDSVGEKLQRVFSDFFREDARVVFDPEVDSWSVTLPAPIVPTATSTTALAELMRKLGAALCGVG